MKAKFVFEALENQKNVLEQLIIDNTKTKNTRAKLLDYLERINSFSEENQTIDRKELTKIVNEFGSFVGGLISGGYHDPRQDEYRKALDVLAEEYGYRNSYAATSDNKTNLEDKALFQQFNFFSVYGLSDLVRKQKFIETHEMSDSFRAFISKYYPNLQEWSELGEKLEEIRKILNPTAEERKKKQLEEIKGKVNPEIKSAIDEIAEDFRKVIEKNEYDWYIRRINLFNEKYPNGANENMKLYLLKRKFDGFDHWDVTMGLVVAADNENEAWEIGVGINFNIDRQELEITELGEANSNISKGVILEDYKS